MVVNCTGSSELVCS